LGKIYAMLSDGQKQALSGSSLSPLSLQLLEIYSSNFSLLRLDV